MKNDARKREASDVIRKNMYTDDVLAVDRDLEAVHAILTEVNSAIKSAQFYLKKWITNDLSTFLDNIECHLQIIMWYYNYCVQMQLSDYTCLFAYVTNQMLRDFHQYFTLRPSRQLNIYKLRRNAKPMLRRFNNAFTNYATTVMPYFLLETGIYWMEKCRLMSDVFLDAAFIKATKLQDPRQYNQYLCAWNNKNLDQAMGYFATKIKLPRE
uniref:Uncharacterized protein n=1 Tax=Glossina pallidipes TaxID=7398 RepID=A0A1A9ZGF8_GLOPL